MCDLPKHLPGRIRKSCQRGLSQEEDITNIGGVHAPDSILLRSLSVVFELLKRVENLIYPMIELEGGKIF